MRRSARNFVLLAAMSALTVVNSSCALADESQDKPPSALVATISMLAPNMVPNFERVSDGIWRGSAPSEEAIEALAHDGVRTIVDLRMDGTGVDKESDKAKHLGLGYFHFPLGFNKPDSDKLKKILAIMTDPVYQPVFVHCRQGADRTGMLVGLYRRAWQGWTFKKTWAEMRQHHFKPFLLTMKREVQSDRKTSIVQLVKPAANKLETLSVVSSTAASNRPAIKSLAERPASQESL